MIKKSAFILAVLAILLTGIGAASANPAEPVTLFEAIHRGNDQGNWNMGLWRHYGDGAQAPYRLDTPCGSVYPGGPINRAAASRVLWDPAASVHPFTLSYDPATRLLSLTVVDDDGAASVTESGDSPIVDPQTYCEGTYTAYAGGEAGKVNNLKLLLNASAGTSVPACLINCKNQPVYASSAALLDLTLNGQPIAGFSVSAQDDQQPGAASFTNTATINLQVPHDAAWTLSGKIALTLDAQDPAYYPKQNRIGLLMYGEFIPNPRPLWDVNGDHVVDISDIASVGLHWGESGPPGWIPQDVNLDGVIDISDIAAIGLRWGQTW